MKITYTFLLHEFTVDIKLLLKLHTMHSVWVHISAKQNINSQPTFYAWQINPHPTPPAPAPISINLVINPVERISIPQVF